MAAVSDDYVESSPSSSGYLNSAMDTSSHEDNQSERAVKMNENTRDNNKMIKICDKLIGVFLVDKPTPTDWRKLLAFSREWDNIRPHFFKRCQEKADTELNPEMKHNLLRLGRKLKEVMHLLVHCRHGLPYSACSLVGFSQGLSAMIQCFPLTTNQHQSDLSAQKPTSE